MDKTQDTWGRPQAHLGWRSAIACDMSARQTRGPARSSVASDRLAHAELVARRGMLLIVVAALLLTGAMVLATSIATLH